MPDAHDSLLSPLRKTQPLPQLSLQTLLQKMTPNIPHLLDTMSFMAQMQSKFSAPATRSWAGGLMHSVYSSSVEEHLLLASCLPKRGI